MSRRRKSQWLFRLEALQSISLAGVADEVNATWLKAHNQKNPSRPLMRLPGERRASGRRMLATLIAMHQVMGNDRKFVVTKQRIADEARMSLGNVTRAILELEAASLISIVRRERERRRGGQGPSEYMIAWANIRDLVDRQGMQQTLFGDAFEPDDQEQRFTEEATAAGNSDVPGPDDLSGQQAAAGEGVGTEEAGLAAGTDASRPDVPSGRAHIPAPSQIERPPSQIERPPSQIERPPSQIEMARTASASRRASVHARARSPFQISLSLLPLIAGGEEEERIWTEEIGPELARLGLREVRETIRNAIVGGWNAQQARALLAQYRQHTIGNVRAWDVGLIWRRLAKGNPGTLIDYPHSESYTRASRTANLQKERKLTELRQATNAQLSDARRQELETRFGAELDRQLATGAAGKLEQLLRTINPYLATRIRERGMTPALRLPLLIALEKRAAGAAKENA